MRRKNVGITRSPNPIQLTISEGNRPSFWGEGWIANLPCELILRIYWHLPKTMHLLHWWVEVLLLSSSQYFSNCSIQKTIAGSHVTQQLLVSWCCFSRLLGVVEWHLIVPIVAMPSYPMRSFAESVAPKDHRLRWSREAEVTTPVVLMLIVTGCPF